MNGLETFAVPVHGGDLHVGRWPGDGPTVLAAHGITGNHISWSEVARQLDGRVTLVAPDLRGRGASNALPGPFGMSAHAVDLVAVLDHLGLERAVVLGHSMGGFVAAVMAHEHPDRVSELVLVDGGLPLPKPEGMSVDEILQAVIGPAMARLSMTFESREAYHAFWKAHPSFSEWSPAIETYIDYDVAGSAPPELRSSVSIDAVRGDAEDTLVRDTVAEAIEGLTRPAVLLRAERGLLNEIPPLIPDELAAAFPKVQDLGPVPGLNHYTILLDERGASAVADAILTAAKQSA